MDKTLSDEDLTDVPYLLHIKNNETGEIREVDPAVRWCGRPTELYFSSGRYGCDCGRETLFSGAYTLGASCGDAKYTMIKVVFKNGAEIAMDGGAPL